MTTEDALDYNRGEERESHEQEIARVLSEYLDRCNTGEQLDEMRIRAEHPGIADDLLVELRALERIPSDVGRCLPPRDTR